MAVYEQDHRSTGLLIDRMNDRMHDRMTVYEQDHRSTGPRNGSRGAINLCFDVARCDVRISERLRLLTSHVCVNVAYAIFH